MHDRLFYKQRGLGSCRKTLRHDSVRIVHHVRVIEGLTFKTDDTSTKLNFVV